MVKEKNIAGIKTILTFKEVEMYLVCGKGVSDAAIKQMNDALATMRKDGTLADIHRKYDL